jgi:predicted Zn-dependent protease
MKTFIRRSFYSLFLIFLFLFGITVSFPQQPAHKATPERRTEYNSSDQTNIANSGKNYQGVFRYRLKENNKSINPSFRDFSENYFRIDKSDSSLWNGRHWSWQSYPLKIYVKYSASKYYRPLYRDYIEYAFKEWEKADNRITFVFVHSSDSADIIIRFVDNLTKIYDENFLGLTETDYNKYKNITRADVQLGLLKFNNEKITDGEMKATIIHEMGHTLGLGHSSNDKDIMYPYINPEWDAYTNFNDLSSGDYLAIKALTDLGFNSPKLFKHE